MMPLEDPHQRPRNGDQGIILAALCGNSSATPESGARFGQEGRGAVMQRIPGSPNPPNGQILRVPQELLSSRRTFR